MSYNIDYDDFKIFIGNEIVKLPHHTRVVVNRKLSDPIKVYGDYSRFKFDEDVVCDSTIKFVYESYIEHYPLCISSNDISCYLSPEVIHKNLLTFSNLCNKIDLREHSGQLWHDLMKEYGFNKRKCFDHDKDKYTKYMKNINDMEQEIKKIEEEMQCTVIQQNCVTQHSVDLNYEIKFYDRKR